MGVAWLAQDLDSAPNEGLAVLSYASARTVGAFLLGAGVRGRQALAGMVLGLVAALVVSGRLAPILFGWPWVAWTWSPVLGALVTILTARLLSPSTPALD